MTISFYKGWTEIWKSEIPPSEFCLISGDWGKLGIANLTRRCLMKCYWMLQNARVTASTVSELLSENQERGLKLPLPPASPPFRLELKTCFSLLLIFSKLQLLLRTFLNFDKVWLYVMTKGIWLTCLSFLSVGFDGWGGWIGSFALERLSLIQRDVSSLH